MLLSGILSTRSTLPIFGAAVFVVYCILPAYLDAAVEQNEYFAQLAGIALVGCIALGVGYSLPLFDSLFLLPAQRVLIGASAFHGVIWGGFFLFLVVTMSTATNIPLLSALQGASVADLDLQRGAFLKGREGLEAILPYLATLFLGALLPYSLTHLFVAKSRWRYPFVGIFLAFTISFLAKSLFLHVALPLLYFVGIRQRKSSFGLIVLGCSSLILLYAVTNLAVSGVLPAKDLNFERFSAVEFFKSSYLPGGSLEFLLWRSIAIPIVTAADTLRLYAEQFAGTPLCGATSSFFAAIFGWERVPLEKLVYELQFGWNDIGNANSVFLTEAFANFGWVGVVVVSLAVGQTLRWFRISRDEGFKSLWLIYCFGLFSGGFIGMLLSNGYLFMFAIALFVQLRVRPHQNDLRVRNAVSGSDYHAR